MNRHPLARKRKVRMVFSVVLFFLHRIAVQASINNADYTKEGLSDVASQAAGTIFSPWFFVIFN